MVKDHQRGNAVLLLYRGMGVNIKWLAEQCGTSVEMIERNYGRHIRDDGDAPLRALLEAQPETFPETLRRVSDEAELQVLEKNGATRRSRTGDLLITNQLLYRLS
jgi:hypothetical protein